MRATHSWCDRVREARTLNVRACRGFIERVLGLCVGVFVCVVERTRTCLRCGIKSSIIFYALSPLPTRNNNGYCGLMLSNLSKFVCDVCAYTLRGDDDETEHE